ncbi:peptidase T [Gracilibacillus kekensis]|uniref:Peptidase T n=1 Tax=Gracilibacillus kekensis TaxID=1027249 RepID=A0A1M7QJZ8_9BACI|nr:peptidase T [Gracilibacillus kekensis]SHN31220.1 peptidase T. Metallo peptidase. MEROPS family M20B [Gracilibacillus kekensis]
MRQSLIDRLVTYAQINTQSNEQNNTCPSTEGQWELAHLLVEELTKIGLEDVHVDEHAYVTATLPSNTDKEVPIIGFLAHLDTATDFTSENVKPQLIKQYDGKSIVLNKEKQIILSPTDYPSLHKYKGHTLMTTDGTTLLGADNKAGIAEIITAMDYFIQHPEIPHGTIRIAFTPDEEIGRGPHKFNVQMFGAEFAYTIDGGPIGELQFESFNAAAAKITIKGNNVHPGTAKGKMVHATKIAIDIQMRLPKDQAPEYTDDYQGFYHLLSFTGDTEEAKMYYIIRDHDRQKFNKKKDMLQSVIQEAQKTHGEDKILLEMQDQYYNMAEKIEPVKYIVDIAEQAIREVGVEPVIQPIRGGTDGSQLSFMGLPTPNIFTGGENFHSKYEFISIDNMVKATETIIKIAENFTKKRVSK